MKQLNQKLYFTHHAQLLSYVLQMYNNQHMTSPLEAITGCLHAERVAPLQVMRMLMLCC
jgi:hypothetical protein